MRSTCKKVQGDEPLEILQKIASKPLRLFAVNERGRRIGEDNPKCRLSDREVELMRKIHEEFPVGHPEHWGYRRLASKFECTKTLARKICSYLLRNQHAVRFTRGTQ